MNRMVLASLAVAVLLVSCAPKVPAVETIAVAGGSERHDLPELLIAGHEEVDKAISAAAQVADAEPAGQGCGVQQYAAGPRRLHDRSSHRASAFISSTVYTMPLHSSPRAKPAIRSVG